jgi:hypothetical protein
MKTAFILISLIVSLSTYANNIVEYCDINGTNVKVNDSIWVLDPNIVKDITSAMKKENKSDDEIALEIKRSDWAGFRLECIETFKLNTNPDERVFGDIVQKTGVAVVLGEYSRDYYKDVKQRIEDEQTPLTKE